MDQPDPSESAAAPRFPGETVAVPDPAFEAMAAALRRSGPRGQDALREAGRAAGEAFFEVMDGGERRSPGEFWDEARRVTASAGVGRPEYAVLAPGVGSVTLTGGPELGRSDPGACHFAAGWIGGLLTGAAGEPVAVFEVRCASLGPVDACRFLVGSAARLRRIRRRLADGEPLFRAVSAGDRSSARSDAPGARSGGP